MIDEIGDGAEEVDLGGRSVPMRAYASWFNFKGADQQKSVGVLSGGERNRLQLAKVMCGLHPTNCCCCCCCWSCAGHMTGTAYSLLVCFRVEHGPRLKIIDPPPPPNSLQSLWPKLLLHVPILARGLLVGTAGPRWHVPSFLFIAAGFHA